MSYPILYSFRRCPYAIRARWTLLQCRIIVRLREVSLKQKPASLLEISPKGTVPVLIVDSNKIIDESLDIMKWAIKTCGRYDLLGHNDIDKENKIKLLIKECDSEFKYNLDRYKYSNRYDIKDVLPYEKKLKKLLYNWNDSLVYNDRLNKMNLVDENESIADLAIWPFVRQYRNIDTSSFENDPRLTNIRYWLNYYLNNSYFPLLMTKINPWLSSHEDEIYPKEI